MKFSKIRKNLKYFAETSQKKQKKPQKKEETPQQNKVLKLFSKNGNASNKKRKRINKIKFKNFFQKMERPQKKRTRLNKIKF